MLKATLYADKELENQTHRYHGIYATLSRDL